MEDRSSISSYNANLVAGSSIDVSGGIAISPTGKKTYGNAGQHFHQRRAGSRPHVIVGGKLTLDSSLKGFSGATGGALNILAPMIQVGGMAKNPGVLLLDPSFFSQGGFAAFSLTGLGESRLASIGVYLAIFFLPSSIAPDTTSPRSWRIGCTPPAPAQAAMSSSRPRFCPKVNVRPSASLSMRRESSTLSPAHPLLRGDIVMGAGALIKTDALGGVSFSGNTVSVLGSVIAPGRKHFHHRCERFKSPFRRAVPPARPGHGLSGAE